MRQLISNDTGKASTMELNTDINIHADGDGGVFLDVCWHEKKELGSVAVHLTADKAQELIDTIQLKCKDVDK
jgi:hypothetical protein